MGKVNIIVMFDEGEIAGVKVNNDLFFRHVNEELLDFFNKRVIPLLYNRGIDFLPNYVKENISIISEENYSFSKNDNVNITEEQLKDVKSELMSKGVTTPIIKTSKCCNQFVL